MAFSEVFPNPSVDRVIFSIDFPELFYIESAIGEIQRGLMERFPIPQLLFQQSVVFAHGVNPTKSELAKLNVKPEAVSKVWQFKDKDSTTIQITLSHLSIESTTHKTYKNTGSEKKFRDIIRFVVDCFLKATGIPLITRIGLRYIDKCPVPRLDNEAFRFYYNTTLPIDRFPLPSLHELHVAAAAAKGDVMLMFKESYTQESNVGKLILDFDGFKERIPALEYLSSTD